MKIRSYLANALDGMAKGLFASLIVGVIIKQIGVYSGVEPLATVGQTAQYMMGPCIGAGIAYSLGGRQLTLLAAAVAGAIGSGCVSFADSSAVISVGEPVGAMASAWIAVELGKRVEGKTRLDLLIVPTVVILSGGIVGVFLSPILSEAFLQLGAAVNEFTYLQPLPMGILLGVAVGMILTLPISSAALCISIGIGGLAAGAALAGCCAQMIGFAAISFKDNKFGGLLPQGIGTSMIQVPNIVKNPWIWLPPTVASAVCGGLASTVFRMETNSVGAGMGTAGLVGQFTTFDTMGSGSVIPMLILHFLLPAVVSLLVCEPMRKKGLIKPGDMRLEAANRGHGK